MKKETIQKYELDGDYILVNSSFGTEHQKRDLEIKSNSKIHVHIR